MSTFQQFFPGGGGGTPLSQGGDAGPGITVAELLLVAGGMPGGGIASPAGTGGGNSGTVITSKAFLFTQGTSYTITIGAAASPSSIVGGTVNLVSPSRAFPPAGGNQRAGAGVGTLQIDQYTFAYGKPSGGVSAVGTNGFEQAGGGGAGQEGGPGLDGGQGAYGGNGIYVDILSAGIVVGGGGGGARATTPAAGGDGGGGAGVFPGTGTAGTANTGGGGGGGSVAGGAGGSGVCIIRYPTGYRAAPSVTGNTPTPAQPGYNVYRWNSGPGTITF